MVVIEWSLRLLGGAVTREHIPSFVRGSCSLPAPRGLPALLIPCIRVITAQQTLYTHTHTHTVSPPPTCCLCCLLSSRLLISCLCCMQVHPPQGSRQHTCGSSIISTCTPSNEHRSSSTATCTFMDRRAALLCLDTCSYSLQTSKVIIQLPPLEHAISL